MILNAGYFHLRHTTMLLEDAPVVLEGAPDTAYVVSLKEGKTLPDDLGRRGDSVTQ